MSKDTINKDRQVARPPHCMMCGKELLDPSKKYCPMCKSKRFKRSKIVWYVVSGVLGLVTAAALVIPDPLPLVEEILLAISFLTTFIVNLVRKEKD